MLVLIFKRQDRPAIFILCVSKIDVEALDIDLLMAHIFKVSPIQLPGWSLTHGIVDSEPSKL